MTPDDALNNPEMARHTLSTSTKMKAQLKVGYYLGKIKSTKFSVKDIYLHEIQSYLTLMKF